MNLPESRNLVEAADPRSALNQLRRVWATGRNTAELIRYGGLEAGEPLGHPPPQARRHAWPRPGPLAAGPRPRNLSRSQN
jgi:hypothetical protein